MSASPTDSGAAHAAFQLSQKLLFLLIDKGLIDPIEARKFLTEMSEMNKGGGPGNAVASQLFAQMAKGLPAAKN